MLVNGLMFGMFQLNTLLVEF